MIRLATLMVLIAVALAMLAPRLHDADRKSPGAGMERPDQIPADPVAAVAGNGLADAVLTRAEDGHFYADAQVNGAAVHFLVDTGASAVVLTRADAQRAGITASAGEFTASAESANGRVGLKAVTIDRIAIGPVSTNGVQGAVAENDLPISLLGQSFLARIARVEIAGDIMRLR
jgi:aspartyl protease family protein